jgi:thiamine monophosphate kinase
MARSGLWNRVEGSARKSPADSPGSEIVRGEHALSRGQTKEGVALLEKAFEAMQDVSDGLLLPRLRNPCVQKQSHEIEVQTVH